MNRTFRDDSTSALALHWRFYVTGLLYGKRLDTICLRRALGGFRGYSGQAYGFPGHLHTDPWSIQYRPVSTGLPGLGQAGWSRGTR